MKMRARKRYNDAWQVGRELFRLNQRISATWLREIKDFPSDTARHDDLMDSLLYVQDQLIEQHRVPPGFLCDQSKSNIKFWPSGVAAAPSRRGMTDLIMPGLIWVDES